VGDSEATAINNQGQVIGDFGFRNGQPGFAFLYTGGTLQELSGLSAEGINDAGEIVGNDMTPKSNNYPHGVISLNGTTYDLNNLLSGASGYVVTDAVAINSSGQIAADAFTPSGQQHAVLLTPSSAPVPAAAPLPPAAWMGLGTMGLLAGGMSCRRRFARA
jgi:probable HAF family extracellular repeat protein